MGKRSPYRSTASGETRVSARLHRASRRWPTPGWRAVLAALQQKSRSHTASPAYRGAGSLAGPCLRPTQSRAPPRRPWARGVVRQSRW
eukprot:scaffold1961_cov119-Isochrysis_galbana.AAC.3